ncbi:hypothetical protein HDE_11184 [Halotydeus destructor]|nr:hypothetical protein HDE_11184 [Halotydeus destructor]
MTLTIFIALITELMLSLLLQIAIQWISGPLTLSEFGKLAYYMFFESWPEYTAAAYQYFLCHIYFRDKSHYQRTSRQLFFSQLSAKTVDHGSEIMSKKQLDDVKKEFDAKFGIIILAQLFSYLTFNAAMVILVRDKGHYLMAELPFFIKHTVLYLMSFSTICYVQSKMKAHTEILIRQILNADHNMSPGTLAWIRELEKHVPLTGCQQVTVEPSLLLHFTGSLISFTVLLIQFIY